MIPLHQADRLGFGAGFQNIGGAFQFEILDHGHHVAVGEDVAVGILDDAVGSRALGIGGGVEGPVVATDGAFVMVRLFKNIGHFTHRTGRLAHGFSKTTGSGVNSTPDSRLRRGIREAP